MSISVCLAGATGWAGSEVARGIAAAGDLALVAGVSRANAGRMLGEVLAAPRSQAPKFTASVFRASCSMSSTDQTLTLRHQAGSSARPYVDGALLAIRKVSTLVGLHRGLDTVLDL
jgi:4-hydroxy-tetrahydrodipicolinate reductase